MTCLTQFLHEIYNGVDKGESCGVVFLDLAKAFDSVDHNILKMKLRCLGFKQSAVTWFGSYLLQRTQCTKLNGKLSNREYVTHGVPQGSILGPMLFVCYMNDLPSYIDGASTYLYADDTAVMVSDKNVQVIELKLNQVIETIHRWFCANRLKVNIGKTKSMLFRSPYRPRDENLLLFFGQEPVEHVSTFKYLGVYLDPSLSFRDHIEYVVKKVRQRTRILWKLRSFITVNLAKTLYTSLIEPLFLYCDELYDGCFQQDVKKLQVAQNNALRAVLHRDPRSDTVSLHVDSKTLWLDEQRKINCCVQAYKLTNGIGPTSLTEAFKPKIEIRQMRSSNEVRHVVPRTLTKFAERDFVVRSKLYWRSLPPEIQTKPSVTSFKNALKGTSIFSHVR